MQKIRHIDMVGDTYHSAEEVQIEESIGKDGAETN